MNNENKVDASRKRRDMPDNLWMQCLSCGKLIYKPKVEEIQNVCPECNYHFEISSAQRIATILDPDSFEEHFENLSPLDPLGFVARRDCYPSAVGPRPRPPASDRPPLRRCSLTNAGAYFIVGRVACRRARLNGERDEDHGKYVWVSTPLRRRVSFLLWIGAARLAAKIIKTRAG